MKLLKKLFSKKPKIHFFVTSKLSDQKKDTELIRTSSELFFLTDIDDVKDELENLKDIKVIKNYRVEQIKEDEYYVFIFMPSFNPNQIETSYGYLYERYEVKK